MFSPSVIIFGTCVGYAIYHLAWAVWFRISLPNSVSPNQSDFQPHATVILSLRGRDPFVAQTIRNLLAQDYSNYQLRIIVDSATDPVWESLKEFEGHPRLKISILQSRLKTCSLKCSAIVQAIAEISNKTEVIALVDADIAPSHSWLQRLVGPLKDPTVGVVTGNQWFSPKENRAGSIIRSLWNAAALLVTYLFKHTWAGSCAMRLSDVKESGLIDRWRKTIVDDGPIDGAMRKLSIKTVFIGDLITVNREECDVPFSIKYNSRMLTWSRIYEWGFVVTLLHMLFTVGMVVTALVTAGIELANGNFGIAGMLLAGLLSIQVLLFVAYLFTESTMRAINQEITAQITPMTIRRAAKFIALIPAALVVYSISAIKATFAKRIEWRNATYEIGHKWEVRLLDDQPFAASALPADQSTSI